MTPIPSRLQVQKRFCRKVAFLRPNEKIPCRKINDLRVSTFLFSVICDRTLEAGNSVPYGRCCSFGCRRGRSQRVCEQGVVGGHSKGRGPEQVTCVWTIGVEGVTRAQRIAGRP